MKTLAALLITLTFISGCAMQSDRARFLPETISTKSKAFIEFASPLKDGNPKNMRQWKRRQEIFNAALITLSASRVNFSKSQTEFTTNIANVEVIIITPKNIDPQDKDKVLVYIHGGAYTFGSAKSTLGCSRQMAHFANMKVISIDYRVAPQNPYPDGLNDCLVVYLELLKKYNPKSIGIFGDSAGGALTASLMLKARDNEIPTAGAIAMMSPWADISRIGDTYYTLEGIDPILSYNANLKHSAKAYVGKHKRDNPYISPVYGDFDGDWPPTLIQVGTREIFLSNAVRLDRRIKEYGHEPQLSVFEGMWHIFQYFPPRTKESKRAYEDMSHFFHANLYQQGQ